MEIGKEMIAVIRTDNGRYEAMPVIVTNVGNKHVTVETEEGYFHTFKDKKERISGKFANYLCETWEEAEDYLALLRRFKITELTIENFASMVARNQLPTHIIPLVIDAIGNPQVLIHYKQGKHYPYLGKGLDATTGIEQIYYMEPDGSVIYNRTPEEMFKLIENKDGVTVQRFVLKDVIH